MEREWPSIVVKVCGQNVKRQKAFSQNVDRRGTHARPIGYAQLLPGMLVIIADQRLTNEVSPRATR